MSFYKPYSVITNQVSISSPVDSSGNVKIAVQEQPITTQRSYTTISNGGTVSVNGIAILQLEGTGNVATVTISGAGNTALNLNSGNALASGSLYEFAIHVMSGDTITVNNATVLRIIVIAGE